MGEGHIQKFIKSLQSQLVLWFILSGLSLVLVGSLVHFFLDIPEWMVAVGLTATWLISAVVIGMLLGRKLAKPTEYIAQTILHISPTEHLVPAPNLETLKFGHELVDSLSRQVYAYATATNQSGGQQQVFSDIQALVNQVPIALLGVDQDGIIAMVNPAATTAFPIENLNGRPLDGTFQFISEAEPSIRAWLSQINESSLHEMKRWPKIELKTAEDTSLGYFDIAISFNKHSASGVDTVIAFYDHTDAYNEEDASMSLIALAVHELRTPLTILRGYIEAFEDELGKTASPQIADDLRKMNASAESLSAFVGNILNVARVNQGQLTLSLREESWNKVLPQIVNSLRNRAGVQGKELELRMQADLPAAAIDQMTIGEVVTNLVENAVKYSPDATAKKVMIVSRLNNEGLIETTVVDQGIGIPESVMPHLFSKFYRNHRSRAAIRGTGLGLFLCKAIITAHHGNIWANSKEGQGSTFGFTLLPYAQLAADQQTSNNEAITQGSHGWIKNHSMQRR